MGRFASFLGIAALASGCTGLLGDFAVGSGDAGADAAPSDGAPPPDATLDAPAPDAARDDAGGADAGSADAGGDTGADAVATCGAPKTQCSPTVCADLTSDGHNCGACGHDCQGGACANSQCQPTVLLQNEQGLSNLVVDAVNVYWTTFTASGGALKTMPLKGAPSPTVLGTFPSAANEVALDDPKQPQIVFCLVTDTAGTSWTIYRANPAQAASAQPVTSGSGHGQGLAADPGHVYGGQNTSTGTASLTAYSLTGGPNVTLFSGAGRVTRIATDASFVVWTDQQNNRVMSAPKQGATPVAISGPGSAGNLADLALAPPTVVWSNYGASIWTGLEGAVSSNGNNAIVPQSPDVSGIASDGTRVFFTDAVDDAVESIALDGGSPAALTKTAAKPTRIGANPGYVVWWESGNANLVKLVR